MKQHIVYWDGAAQVMKEEKRGLWRGLRLRLRMYWQILVAWIRSKQRNM